MSISIYPRYSQLTGKPLTPRSAKIPESLLEITGAVRRLEPLGHGITNQVFRLVGDEAYILKIAYGEYRQAELQRAHCVMSALYEQGLVPVPQSLKLEVEGDFSFQLQTCLPGDNLQGIAGLSAKERAPIWRALGKTLAAIHELEVGQVPWEQWFQGQLAQARANMRTNILGPAEFVNIGTPEEVLRRLEEERPEPVPLCLLHGDFRPKNILWEQDQVVGVVDWDFCDIGHPYYDLAIMSYYLQTAEEGAAFAEGYGRPIDVELVRYFDLLSKFLNV